MVRKHIVATYGLVIMITFFFGVDGYLNKEMLKFYSLSKSHPLKTAGHERCGYIPRLEPGLRLLKPQLDTKVPFTSFSLDWLKNCEEVKFETTRVPLDALFSKVFKSITKVATTIGLFAKRIFRSLACFLPTLLSLAAITQNMGLANAANVGGDSTNVPFHKSLIPPLHTYKSLSPTQKLSTTPVYFVCNSRGSSYLQEDMQSGLVDQKIVTYFMSSEDASDYLNDMTQVNGGNTKEFKIMTTSFEKVMNQIQAKKQSRKFGRHNVDVLHRIQPSSRQCENVASLHSTDSTARGKKDITIPVFSADGLFLRRANGEVVSPYYFALEDLNDDWEKLKGGELPKQPKVKVNDFTEVFSLSKGITSELLGKTFTSMSKNIVDALKNPGIVPPRREIEMIKKYYRNQSLLKNEFSKAKFRPPQ